MITYLDNAASSWPKPPSVAEVMKQMMLECTANPGRGAHQMAVQASRVLFDTRNQLAKLFNVKNPNDIFFTQNTSMSLNMAIQGFVKNNDHIITTTIEHNSVRRPLEQLKKTRNVDVTYLNHDVEGYLNLDQLRQQITNRTRIIIINHSSNLLGTIMPIAEIGELARKHNIKLLVDAAQTAGVLPIDVRAMNIDMLAFPGHKGLLGPQGTGGLYVDPNLELEPLIVGGTGSKSEEIYQPMVRPDRYETGTQNTVGIAGLGAGVKFVLAETVAKIHEKETRQIQYLYRQLESVPGIQILGPSAEKPRTGIVSFVIDQADPSEVAFILDQSFNIAVRSGYHCTPLAHQTAGTMSAGAVRASISYFTTNEEIEHFIEAIKEISKHYHKQVT